ncbi:MAG: hypothetical protein JWP12_2480 [Bacteroidetes bacterium]|nr:hypothetical protein [Bacteroidota bacterium]
MIRVYFDWNVFTELKQKKSAEEPFVAINSIIQNNKNKLLFPYSPAHLRDLQRGFNKTEKSNAYIYDDLLFLEEISQNYCLYVDSKDKNVRYDIINATEYFDVITVEKEKDYTFDELFTLDSDNSFLTKFKTISTGIDINSIPDKYNKVKSMFANLSEENNIYSLMKDIHNITSSPEAMEKAYKSARNLAIEGMKINGQQKQWESPFDSIENILAKAPKKQTFHQKVEESLKIANKDKELTRFDYFTNYYISLDTYGYYGDDKFPNLIDDAIHAFYGAFCEFFVTKDDNTYHKTKAVYEKLKIGTIVCKPDEFPLEFQKINADDKSIIDRIVEVISNAPILLNTVDDEQNPVSLYEIKQPLVDFFDRLQISRYEEYNSLYMYKKIRNYSDFLFWSEIKSVVDKIVANFGIDYNFRKEFDDFDKEEIVKNEWKGRLWTVNNIVIVVGYDPDTFGLALKFMTPKNVD